MADKAGHLEPPPAQAGDLMSGSEGEEEIAAKKQTAEMFEQAENWEVKNVDIDKKTLEGRRANRGFTMSMGKATADPEAAKRRENRAQTLPATSDRRGDFKLSNDVQQKLVEAQELLKARVRRGSVVVAGVVPQAEMQKTWERDCTCHLAGIMTEGQQSGDERKQEFYCGTKLPDNIGLPPIVSCTKGSKGFRDMTPNQDNFSLTYFKNGWTMCCCMDGHGPYGHIVSTQSVNTVPYFLANNENFPDNMPKGLTEAFLNCQKSW